MTGVSGGKVQELRQLRLTQKRKDVFSDHKSEAFDPAFIQDDRKILSELRQHEHPALTRGSVLCKPGAVINPLNSVSLQAFIKFVYLALLPSSIFHLRIFRLL